MEAFAHQVQKRNDTPPAGAWGMAVVCRVADDDEVSVDDDDAEVLGTMRLIRTIVGGENDG